MEKMQKWAEDLTIVKHEVNSDEMEELIRTLKRSGPCMFTCYDHVPDAKIFCAESDYYVLLFNDEALLVNRKLNIEESYFGFCKVWKSNGEYYIVFSALLFLEDKEFHYSGIDKYFKIPY
ncbi:hypothetical protein [Aminobacterium colombiense]